MEKGRKVKLYSSEPCPTNNGTSDASPALLQYVAAHEPIPYSLRSTSCGDGYSSSAFPTPPISVGGKQDAVRNEIMPPEPLSKAQETGISQTWPLHEYSFTAQQPSPDPVTREVKAATPIARADSCLITLESNRGSIPSPETGSNSVSPTKKTAPLSSPQRLTRVEQFSGVRLIVKSRYSTPVPIPDDSFSSTQDGYIDSIFYDNQEEGSV